MTAAVHVQLFKAIILQSFFSAILTAKTPLSPSTCAVSCLNPSEMMKDVPLDIPPGTLQAEGIRMEDYNVRRSNPRLAIPTLISATARARTESQSRAWPTLRKSTLKENKDALESTVYWKKTSSLPGA
ncbi:hypothetical protein CROQUDRAFT_87567 [Cronartium quercuum f. sp. fusiforme G11]|uniref:Uncharacterized protein n=1 Tax=Cronartium quercuum f. sp. fusiforme G11 TaxID=708437 RepID=A0A9P6NRM8_9BASI|nr:hypothetical protein CROQUDRAFT_87567 [Cronartium quercuum f. sp. fusiforme G11]